MNPSPAIVLMIPAVSTWRTRWLSQSAMYRLPSGSTWTPEGRFRRAFVASPPSPENPSWPLPATVVMVPIGSTCRTR